MKNEYFSLIQPFLQWKLKSCQYDINEVQIANYAKISLLEAENVLSELIRLHVVDTEIKANCPNCFTLHKVESEENLLICNECGEEFYPLKNKRLLYYKYMLNPNSKLLREHENSKVLRHQIAKRKLYGGGIGEMNRKVKVFLSYSHSDEQYKNELDKHLSVLRRSEKVDTWNDRALLAGAKLDDEIEQHLRNDDIFILLISSDFINSDYCYNKEMQKAIERANANQCIMVPVIVRPCLWQVLPIKDFLAMPQDGKPISKYEDRDEAYTEVVSAINNLINTFE